MSIGTFDKDNIASTDMYIFENKIFDSLEDVEKYVDSCECEYTTNNFLLDRKDFIKYVGAEELIAGWEVNTLADMEEAFDEYEEVLENNMMKYEIEAKFERDEPAGPKYKLSGTFGAMKKFAKEYSDYLDWSAPGEALFDVEERSKIDFDSGDEELYLFNFDFKKFHK